MELYVGIPTANLSVDLSRLFAPHCPTGRHRPFRWDTFVLGLARHQLVHRLGCQPFPVRLASIERRLLGAVPAEHCHKLVLGRAVLCRDGRPGLSEPVRRAMRKPSLPTPCFEPIAERLRAGIGPIPLGYDIGQMAGRAGVQFGAERWQDRDFAVLGLPMLVLLLGKV